MTGDPAVIIRNAAQCIRCGDVIESKYRHDFVSCSCGNVFVDGGLDYLRRGFEEQRYYVDLSEFADPNEGRS